MKLPSLLVLTLSASTAAGTAHALIGDVIVDANTSTSPWAGVGSITIAGGGTFSGALIGPRHVLTAAHVVSGARLSPGDITFNLNHGGDLTFRTSAEAVHLFPGYQGTRPGSDGLWHDDIAVVELSAPVPDDVPVYPLYQGIPGLTGASRELVFVGYGAGEDAAGARRLPADPSVKRVGRNEVDVLVRDRKGDVGFDLCLYRFDRSGRDQTGGAGFVTASEALFAGGDSGSPVFVEDDGVWKIAGVATFAGTRERDGSSFAAAIGGGALVSPYAEWINTQTARPPAPPEPPSPISWAVAIAVLCVGSWLAWRFIRRRAA